MHNDSRTGVGSLSLRGSFTSRLEHNQDTGIGKIILCHRIHVHPRLPIWDWGEFDGDQILQLELVAACRAEGAAVGFLQVDAGIWGFAGDPESFHFLQCEVNG